MAPNRDSRGASRGAIWARELRGEPAHHVGRQGARDELVDEFYDAAVSGADPVTERRGFKEMLDRIASDGVPTIIIESPDPLRPRPDGAAHRPRRAQGR